MINKILNFLRKITPRPIFILYHHFLATAAAVVYGFPSRKFIVIGVTGTDGKTTTATLIAHILQSASFRVGLSTTVECRINNQSFSQKTQRTTPGRFLLQKILSKMAQEKVKYAVVETTSHALDQGRHLFIDYDIACLTNITPEHLDYHKTFEAYREAKTKLFRILSHTYRKGQAKTAVLNRDDPSYDYFSQIKTERKITYGIEHPADIMADKIRFFPTSSQFTIKTPKGEFGVNFPLPGRHNIYNALAATAVAFACGVDIKNIQAGLQTFSGVPGRMEKVQISKDQDLMVIVDYAHTPNSLEKILTSTKNLLPKNKKLICVFGCGGDRDREKRPKMGAVASKIADQTIVTTDNPRSEDPQKIIEEILAGIPKNRQRKVSVQLDRKKAIFKAIKEAGKGDIVLIAGKGHETYQIFKERTIHFDDRQVSREALAVRRKIKKTF